MVKVTNNAWLLFSAHVAGELIPEAMVTARAVLPRAQSVFGYYAVTTDGDATIYDSYFVQDNVNPMTSMGGFWLDWCRNQGTYCDLPTKCSSDGTMYFSTWNPDRTPTPEPCPRTSSNGDVFTCITEYLYESLGASEVSLSKLACIRSPWSARTYYKTKPESTSATTTDASVTGSISSSLNLPSGSVATSTDPTSPSSLSPPPSLPPPAASNDNKEQTGIIAGSVVGGVVALGAMALFALFLIRRSRRESLDAPGEKVAVYEHTCNDLPEYAPHYSSKLGAIYGAETHVVAELETNHRVAELEEFRPPAEVA